MRRSGPRSGRGAEMAGEHGEFSGACHCGRLQVRFTTLLAAERLVPRACDCSFCQKHGAAYVSDPRGALRMTLPAGLAPYRQGAGNAQFHVCDRCGVLVAVTYENEAGRRFGTVNVRCLDAAASSCHRSRHRRRRCRPRSARRAGASSGCRMSSWRDEELLSS